jgi:flagellar L-ring protein FlgH
MRLVCLLSLFILISACASVSQRYLAPGPNDADWQMQIPGPMPVATEAAPVEGSVYNERGLFTLFQDRRPFRVGDILTIVLNERTQSSKSANTNIKKENDISLPSPTFGGKVVEDINLSIGSDRDFGGSANSSQQNSLRGSISVSVAQVLSNETLRVVGEKWIKINQGDEYIRLQGLVRVDDIDVSNRVSSERISGAKIAYSGKGQLADANTQGWLSRFFGSAFFPY